MAALILPHRWRRQPPVGVGLDLSHPIAGAALEVYSFNSPLAYTRPLKGRNALNKSGAVTFDTGLSGHGERGDGSTGYLGHSSLNIQAWPFAIGVVTIAPPTPASASSIVALGDGSASGASTFAYIYFSTDGTLSAVVRVQDGGTVAFLTGPTVTPGQVYACAFLSRSATAHELWVNGRLFTSSTNIGPFDVPLGRFGVLAVDRSGALAAFSQATVSLAWNSIFGLPSEVYAEWTLNPWAMFLPVGRRLWVSAAVSGDVSVTLTGVSAAGAVDTLSATATEDAAVTLTGVSATAAVNDLEATLAEVAALTEVSAAGAVSNLSVDVTADASIELVGVSAAGAVNDVSASISGDVSVTLDGLSAASAVADLSVTADTADSVSIAGVSAASAVGTLSVSETANYTATLTEVSAAAAVNDLTASEGLAEALTGVSAASAVGSLTADTASDVSVVLTGVSAAATVDSFAFQLDLTILLTGVSASADVRSLIIPRDQPLLEEELAALLKPLVQGHVYPLRRPQMIDGKQARDSLPDIVYTIVSDDWQQAETLCGVGLHNTRVQIDVYAAGYREARAYAYAVAQELDTLGWRINMQPFPDDDEKIFRWQLEYSCWRNEAPPSLPLISTHRG